MADALGMGIIPVFVTFGSALCQGSVFKAIKAGLSENRQRVTACLAALGCD